MRTSAIFALFLFGFLLGEGQAGLPPRPEMAPVESPTALPDTKMQGKVALAIGDVRITRSTENAKHGFVVKKGMTFGDGDILSTGENGKIRLEMKDGVVLQVGGVSQIGFHERNGQWALNVWEGAIMAYGFPSLKKQSAPHAVVLPQGEMGFHLGKIGLEARNDQTRILAFHNQAEWKGDREPSLQITAGMFLTSGDKTPQSMANPDNLSIRFTELTSPEFDSVASALASYQEKRLEQAMQQFGDVQAAYPHNSLAAYYLGLLNVEKQDYGAAIPQWRKYERLDPNGAKEKEIAQQLTVLISKRMKEEVKEALAQEAALMSEQPEPNSMAVPPFANKGDPKFEAMARGITAMIIADLSKVPGVKVLERAKMQKLVDEIKLSQSGLVEEKTMVRAGRLMKAEKLILGDYNIK
ncbi:MAG: hypothetical protein HQL94_06400 [Magnetococcales bacterium]|nr:hypothetical protein [Magnetococcales bacterium]MBF0439637.1 hypothetical protein [Magnetococcales bacterium]